MAEATRPSLPAIRFAAEGLLRLIPEGRRVDGNVRIWIRDFLHGHKRGGAGDYGRSDLAVGGGREAELWCCEDAYLAGEAVELSLRLSPRRA